MYLLHAKFMLRQNLVPRGRCKWLLGFHCLARDTLLLFFYFFVYTDSTSLSYHEEHLLPLLLVGGGGVLGETSSRITELLINTDLGIKAWKLEVKRKVPMVQSYLYPG